MNGSTRRDRPDDSGDRAGSAGSDARRGAEAPDGSGAGPDAGSAGPVRLTAWVRGRVQGVGFRWWTRATALEIGGLSGYVCNLEDGRVQVVAEGDHARCERLLDWLRHGATPGRVDGVTEIWGSPRGCYPGFRTR